jgi:hypothetical protein
MLTFSEDGATADRQMRAVIFYLTTFGYIDGEFDRSERAFVRRYIEQLVARRVAGAVDPADSALTAELATKFTTHFHEVFEGIDREVCDLFTEAVADGENHDAFVHSQLKVRCFEIFKSFDAASQELLMDSVSELILADGEVHPAEAKFRNELADLLEDDLGVELLDEAGDRAAVAVRGPTTIAPAANDDPLLDGFEVHYSLDSNKLREQLEQDRGLVEQVMTTLEDLRFKGAGKLGRAKSVDEFKGQTPFLDAHVHVVPARPGVEHDVTVVGDLHGCYSCLKAVLAQSRFLEKVARFKSSPRTTPFPMLVLLGDYIDRGMFSYQGVLRAAMELFVREPDHVFMLRGNHEYYFEHKGQVYGGVKPAEAINTLKPHVPSQEMFQQYMAMFDMLPNVLLFDKFFFVHGGIPRDRLLKERYTDLSSLNDDDLRFQMMWSDPSSADVIPAALQEQSSRFPFGRLQCQAFLQKLGCHTLIRGHEKVNEGFRRVYDDENQLLISLFSAGGANNGDLPPDSSYRSVTPAAMTLTLKDGQSEIVPWRIRYEEFNSPERNRFFRQTAEIPHRAD